LARLIRSARYCVIKTASTYRIDINLLTFVAVGALALAITWLTVGLQAIKAGLANPVEALRYE
jgi:ABC-type lipoprotein release transport system permease subunit